MGYVRRPSLFLRYRNARLISLDDNHITFESRCVADGKIKTHWCSYYKKHRETLEKAIINDSQVNLLVVRYIVPTNTEEERKKYGIKNRADDILEYINVAPCPEGPEPETPGRRRIQELSRKHRKPDVEPETPQ